MNAILKGLNGQQQKGVKSTKGPVLILAGAGSGKTKVLTRRIAYLIKYKGVKPWNILALTFTNKAAKEMKTRIAKLLNNKKSGVWASTFHKLGMTILHLYAPMLNYSRNFSVADQNDQQIIAKHILVHNLHIDEPKKKDIFKLLNSISYAKDRLMTPKEYYQYSKKYHGKNFQWKKMCKGYKLYEKILKHNQAFDFDDMIMLPVILFKKYPEILKHYQHKFTYISVDEYQDTNEAQYEMVNMIANKHKNICVVGDVDQSIYGWRGADIHNILNFSKDYPSATVIKMEENYRSTKNILTAANSIIRNNPFSQRKHLWTNKPNGYKIQYYTAPTGDKEAKFVTDHILNAVHFHGMHFKDFVVLYRVNAQSRAFEDRMLKLGMPYQVIGGFRFYDRAEIQDVLAYLKLILNPNDDMSFARVINKPKRHIGKVSLHKLQSEASKNHESLLMASEELDESSDLSSSAINTLKQFGKMIMGYHNHLGKLTITEQTKVILNDSNYLPTFKKEAKDSDNEKDKLGNLLEFFTVTNHYDKDHKKSNHELRDFVSNIALLTSADSTQKSKDRVSLMTVHSAKGLEFPVVFLVGMEQNMFPMFYDVGNPKTMPEERRLAYVAVTRAEKLLYITNASTRVIYGYTHHDVPSEFIDEIKPKSIINNINKAQKEAKK